MSFFYPSRKGVGVVLVKACPRCKKLIHHGAPCCAECLPIVTAAREEKRQRKAEYLKKQYNRNYNRRRDPKYVQFYRSKDWKATSKAKLTAAGWRCEARLEGCTGLAVEVHHIKPIQTDEGWNLRLEWNNLEALCTACHNGRHPEKGKRKRDTDVLDMREVMRNL